MNKPASLTVYVSVGNSDDRLSQREWSRFVARVDFLLDGADTRHGFWLSASDARWQNACWCVQFTEYEHESADAFAARVAEFKGTLSLMAKEFRQDSIAWAVAETEFITPPNGDGGA